MSADHLSRREFLLLSVKTAFGLVVAGSIPACTTAPTKPEDPEIAALQSQIATADVQLTKIIAQATVQAQFIATNVAHLDADKKATLASPDRVKEIQVFPAWLRENSFALITHDAISSTVCWDVVTTPSGKHIGRFLTISHVTEGADLPGTYYFSQPDISTFSFTTNTAGLSEIWNKKTAETVAVIAVEVPPTFTTKGIKDNVQVNTNFQPTGSQIDFLGFSTNAAGTAANAFPYRGYTAGVDNSSTNTEGGIIIDTKPGTPHRSVLKGQSGSPVFTTGTKIGQPGNILIGIVKSQVPNPDGSNTGRAAPIPLDLEARLAAATTKLLSQLP